MKKHVCILFCIVLIMSVPVRAYASAASGTLTVASGSGSAVGGLFSDYGLNSKTSAIALTLVLLNSLGATVKLTDQAIQAGKKVEDVIMDKFAQWVGGSSAESMTEDQREELKKRFKVINGGSGSDQSGTDGPNVGPDGKIYFGLGALGILTEFIKWLKGNDQLEDFIENPPGVGEYPGYYGSKYIFSQSNNGEYSVSATVDGVLTNVYFICCKERASASQYVIAAYSTSSFTFHRTNYGSGVHGDSYKEGNMYWSRFSNNSYLIDYVPDGWFDISTLGYYGRSGLQRFCREVQPIEQPPGITSDGIYKGENYNDSILDNPDQPVVVDPGILPNVTPESDQQVSIPDYLQMILDNLNANAAQSQDPLQVPVTDPVTLSPGTLTVPVQEEDPINQPLPAETIAPEDVPANPVQDPSQTPKPTDTIKLFKVDLTDIFPFCIPWDIYNLLSKFAADPVTPSVDWDWGSILGFLGINTVTHMDLHDYDGVAEILRNMETVVFCIGLAYATKKVFIK